MISVSSGSSPAPLTSPEDALVDEAATLTVLPWTDRIVPSTEEWFTVVPPPRQWLLRDSRGASAGVLPKGKVGLLIAEGGAGKTMALVSLAVAIATGEHWLGTFSTGQPGRVLMLLGEEDLGEIHRRAYNARRSGGGAIPIAGSIVAMPLTGQPCNLVCADRYGNPTSSAFLIWLTKYAKETGPYDVILLDPLSRFASGDTEVDASSATRFVQALESLTLVDGATVIVAHHTNKIGRGAGVAMTASSARGSTGITDGGRWAAAISVDRLTFEDEDQDERLGEIVTFSVVKTNYSKACDPVLLRRDQENGGALLALDEADAQAVGDARANSSTGAKTAAARDALARTTMQAVVDTVRAALTDRPGMSGRALLAEVVSRRGRCSRPVFEGAIAAMGATVRREPGPDRSMLFYLVGA